MKNNILIIWVILFITSCGSEKYGADDHARWYIKNSIEYPIKALILTYDGGKQVILPNDSVSVRYEKIKTKKNGTTFDLLYSETTWEKLNEQDQRIDIISEKGVVLKTWYYKNKGESGKQFFDEKYWKLYKKSNIGPTGRTDYNWIFEITPEDIDPINVE